MKPGRKLDALIAEHVVGHLVEHWNGHYAIKGDEVGGVGVIEEDKLVYCFSKGSRHLPNYSTDIAAAFEVVEKLRADELNFTLGNGKNGNQHQAEFRERTTRALYTGKWWFSIADTAPHAICLAALKVLEINVESESENPAP